jgi:hypothetical protein
MDRTRDGKKGDGAEMNSYEEKGTRDAEGEGGQREKGCWEEAEGREGRADGIGQKKCRGQRAKCRGQKPKGVERRKEI